MPEYSRVALIPAPDATIRVESLPIPQVESGGVLLKTVLSEVCGTDCHLWHGKLAGVPYPLIPGHVSVGEIVAMGGRVKDLFGEAFRDGDVVAFYDVHETCGACWHCLVARAATRCPERRVYGITYGAADGLLGGWSEYIYLKPGVKLLRLPETVSAECYIAGGCGSPTAFHAVQRAQIQLGESVVVQGSGPVGLNAVVFARLSGAGQIIVVGAPAMRLEIAKAFGADAVIDIGECAAEQRLERVREATRGIGADVVIEASGNPQAVAEGCRMARDAGRYVIVGQYTDNGPVEINPHLDINQKHLDIRGCWGSEFAHFYGALEVMGREAARFDWTQMISGRYGLDEAQTALEDVEGLKVIKALIDPWKGNR